MSVIEFPGPPKPTQRPNTQDRQAELERHRAELVKNVRAAAKNPEGKFDQRDDEIYPARAVSRLIGDLKKRGKTLRDIYDHLSKRHFTDRHLERYRADHTVSPREATIKAPRDLSRKAQPYVRILDTFAEMLELSADDVIYDAFRETSFWRSAMVSVDDPASDLSWLIHEMARFVIRAEQLADYFRQASAIATEYHPGLPATFERPCSPAEPILYEGMDMPPEAVPRLPTLPLLRVRKASFSGLFRAERKLMAPRDFTAAQAETAMYEARNSPAHDRAKFCELADRFDGKVSLYIDIQLVIGPKKWIGIDGLRDDHLVPMFQTRWYFELKNGGKNYALTCPLESLSLCNVDEDDAVEIVEPVQSVAARFDDGWRQINGAQLKKGREIFDFPKAFIGPNQSFMESIYFLQVDAATVRMLMDFLSQHPDPDSWFKNFTSIYWLCELIGPEPKPSEFRYESARCREFETALQTAAIETALAEDCRRLKERLARRIAQRKATLERDMEAMLARWRKTD